MSGRRKTTGDSIGFLFMDFPFLLSLSAFFVLLLFFQLGKVLRKKVGPIDEEDWKDFSLILGATLTLTGLLIGFSFSMAVIRYDQRKNYEEEEANAIGTEYARAELLPSPHDANVRRLLVKYLDQRIAFYVVRDDNRLALMNAETAQLQKQLWSEVAASAAGQPTPTVSLAVSGMNDVLNRQGYTQAAWLNRIPVAAWSLMMLIAICSNLLIGYSIHKASGAICWVVPLVVAISFFLIADIDSPRRGLILVRPQNLMSLAESLKTH